MCDVEGEGIRDPVRHEAAFLQRFLDGAPQAAPPRQSAIRKTPSWACRFRMGVGTELYDSMVLGLGSFWASRNSRLARGDLNGVCG